MTEITQFLLQDVVPGLNKGFWISVYLIVPSALLGFGLGVVVGSLRVYGSPWVMRCANAFVSVFRGTPLVVQLFFWYFVQWTLEQHEHRHIIRSALFISRCLKGL